MKLFLDSSVLVPVFWPNTPTTPRVSAFTHNATRASRAALLTVWPRSIPPRRGSRCHIGLHRIQAIEFLESIHRRFRLVSLDGDVYLASIREAAANRISGGAIYDALIARCAVQAGADQIFTWNTRHYQLLGAEVSKRIKSPALD